MSKYKTIVKGWGAIRHSKNKLDGISENLEFRNCLPLLFRTRSEAREWIEKEYGYIRTRPDLRREPHGWRMPRAVRVKVTVEKEG